MKLEKKIFLDRIDDLTIVVDKIIKTPAAKVILNIPRQSVLGSSLNNFQILKREAETAGKEIVIESIDDQILELVSVVGLKSSNPVFGRSKEKSVSDILPRSDFSKGVQDVSTVLDRESPPAPIFQNKPSPKKLKVFKSQATVPVAADTVFAEPRAESKSKLKTTLLSFIIVVLAASVFLVVVKVLPRATIRLTLKKAPIDFEETVRVSSKTKNIEVSDSQFDLPGELLIASRNLNVNFDAHGKEVISSKARGTLNVYNAYSSQPQTLVKSTRFETPDKKIFRLINQVVIPGAKVVNGKIQPSKIEVAVQADEAGDVYNIPPTVSWRIPGLKGSPRYEGFYGESLKAMTGGFVGEKAVPTKDDLEEAKLAVRKTLEESLKSEMLVLLDNKFKLLDNSTLLTITKEEIGEAEANGARQFSVFMAGEMRRMVFEEKDLKEALKQDYVNLVPSGFELANFQVIYSKINSDLANDHLTFEVKGAMLFKPLVNEQDIRRELLGKDEKTIKSLVFSLPGLERATISLWPFWVHRVPSNNRSVTVFID